MKGRSLNTAAAALTAAVLLTSAACAGEFPTGRFAVQNNGHFHNFTTFNCIDRGPTFCENLNRKKLSDEEKKYIQGVPVKGDLLIEKDQNTGKYTAAGNLYVLNNCLYTTAERHGQDPYVKTECGYNEDAGLLKCSLINPFRNHQTGEYTSVTFYLYPDENGIVIDNTDVRSDDTGIDQDCAQKLQNTVLAPEPDDEFRHNMYISSKLTFMVVDGNLNAVWKALPKQVQSRNKKAQLEWVKQKEKKCGSVLMKGSEEQLTAMYKCQLDETLKQLKVMTDYR